MTIFLFVVLFVLLVFLYFTYRHNFKKVSYGAICLITGGVKTGKSLLSVELSLKEYKKRHRKWWFATHVLKKDIEEPLFYTNVVVSFKNWRNSNNIAGSKIKPHRLDKNIMCIPKEVLLRQNRIAYKSVVYIQESSLIADQQEFNDKVQNTAMSLFNKLFGHETKGGVLFYDTQSPSDNHYSIKRVVSTFNFIQKSKNFFFFRVLYIREMVNGDMLPSVTNSINEDIDFTTRKYIIWRHVYKKYDRYYFSYLTDNLEFARVPFIYQKQTVSFSDIYNDFFSGLSYEEVKKMFIERSNESKVLASIELYKKKEEIKKGGVK